MKLPGHLYQLSDHRLSITISITCVVAIAVLVILRMFFWEWLSGNESGSTTIRNIALVAAGFIALVLATWRSKVAERQANTAHQTLLNEQYQKGAEMLGNEVLSVRLGGIYALQRLAEEWPDQYHLQIMRLFCTFVRLPTKDRDFEPGQTDIEPGTLLGIRPDVGAVMEILGSRSDLGIVIERKAEFRLDLRGCDLRGGQLINADHSNAYFHQSNLSGVNCANTDLTDAFLLDTDLSRAQFRNVKFARTRLQFTNLSDAMLQNEDLPGTYFDYADLSRTNFMQANLDGSTFQHTKAPRTSFERADVSGTLFLETDLSHARFTEANLTTATFRGVDMTGVDLTGANLSGAKFSGGSQPVEGLTQTQLDQARADPENPPRLDYIIDPKTGHQLTWRDRPLNEG